MCKYFFLCICLHCICLSASDDKNSDFDWYGDVYFKGIFANKCQQIWILSILASCVVGLSGTFPLIFVYIGLKLNKESKVLRLLLSFAVGGLLGDVFLHLLPEAWDRIVRSDPHNPSNVSRFGGCVILGLVVFVVIEKMFSASQRKTFRKNSVTSTENISHTDKLEHSNGCCNGNSLYHESHVKTKAVVNGTLTNLKNERVIKKLHKETSDKHIAGYLNLVANCIDNFTHGLSVAGSFLAGTKMGLLTTSTILIHEIPHEIGDFAILLKSGFDPWEAARAQLSTAGIGILGAVAALCCDSSDKLGDCTSWILPFTAGGFLHIALVNVLPDLMEERDPWESLKQMSCLIAGIGIMAAINTFCH